MSLKVLLFYVTGNSGHFKAAESIKYALESQEEKIRIKSLDCFNYTNPVLSRIIYRSYFSLIKTKPELWGYLYDNPKVIKKINTLKELIHKYDSSKLESIIKEYNPDAIVCTQAFPCGLVADYKNTYKDEIPLIGVLTDYYAHSFWIYPFVNAYVVASEEAKNRFLAEGIPENKIFMVGIPVMPKFFQVKNKEDICKKLFLDCNIPTVFIMSGSKGMGPLKDIIYEIDSLDLNFQMIISTGSNESLQKKLKSKELLFKHRTRIFGYIDNVEEFMRVSDILITKPGGITVAEAVASEIPMVIFNPIGGQEKNNTKYLLERNMALEADTPRQVSICIKDLFINRNLYLHIKESIIKNKVFNPSLKIADLIIQTTACRNIK